MTSLRKDLTIVPEWRSIDKLRQSIGYILDAMGGDADRRDALQMVSSELMENAFKHGSCADSPVSYHLEWNDSGAKVTVGNCWAPERDADIRKLEQIVEWIGTFDDPMEAYQAKMVEAFRADDPNTSGLGLARIAYEGSCALSCQVDCRAHNVQVSAELSGFNYSK